MLLLDLCCDPSWGPEPHVGKHLPASQMLFKASDWTLSWTTLMLNRHQTVIWIGWCHPDHQVAPQTFHHSWSQTCLKSIESLKAQKDKDLIWGKPDSFIYYLSIIFDRTKPGRDRRDWAKKHTVKTKIQINKSNTHTYRKSYWTKRKRWDIKTSWHQWGKKTFWSVYRLIQVSNMMCCFHLRPRQRGRKRHSCSETATTAWTASIQPAACWNGDWTLRKESNSHYSSKHSPKWII